MIARNIWIPSIQKSIKIKEFDSEQYRTLLKALDDEGFEEVFDDTLLYNSNLSKNEYQNYTIIDKFAMILQLKIYSCSPKLVLSRECPKCQTNTSFTVDLNSLIDELSLTIDKSFKTLVSYNTYTVLCDVPTIKLHTQYSSLPKTQDTSLDYYLYSFIQEITISNSRIILTDHNITDRTSICDSLPFELMTKIKTKYTDLIYESFKQLLFLKTKCASNVCDDEMSLNFDINNIDDIIKILFRDDSALGILYQYASVSSQCHFDYNFYKNISPYELSILHNNIKEGQNEEPEESNKDIDLFEEYKLETEGMVENPSEFK